MIETIKSQKHKNVRVLNLERRAEKKLSLSKIRSGNYTSWLISGSWILFCAAWIMLSITNGKIFLDKILISSFIITCVLFNHGFQGNNFKDDSTSEKEKFQ